MSQNRKLYAAPDYNLWILLFQARNAVVKARTRELKKCGVKGEESFALYVIKALGEQAIPATIARLLIREPNTVSGLLSTMEKKGLITRSPNRFHRNMVTLTLTEKGEKAHRKASKRESLRNVMSALSDKEQKQLVSSLKLIRGKALHEIGQDYEFVIPPPDFGWILD